jgi:hypothetical protein
LMSETLIQTHVRDDITFFEDAVGSPEIGTRFNWLKAVRFFPNSWLLLTTGWPCAESGKKKDGENKLTHISGLYVEWRDSVKRLFSEPEDARVFRNFPDSALRSLHQVHVTPNGA